VCVFAGCVSAPLKLNTSECKYAKKGIKGVQIAFETRIVSAHFRSLLVADVPQCVKSTAKFLGPANFFFWGGAVPPGCSVEPPLVSVNASSHEH